MTNLLTISGLTVRFHLRDAVVRAVTDLNLTVRPGELLAVVGESGCGKSVLAHALLGLLPANATVTGEAHLTLNPDNNPDNTAAGTRPAGTRPAPYTRPASHGRSFARSGLFARSRSFARSPLFSRSRLFARSRPSAAVDRIDHVDDVHRVDCMDRVDDVHRVDRIDQGEGGPGGCVDLLACGEKMLASTIRGRRIGLIPQSPATSLTVVRRGRRLLTETLKAHGRDPRLADQVAEQAGLDSVDLERYPFELSGGMAQRLATALALAGEPPLLIADEPTSGLDRPLVDHTLDLLRRRCDEGAAVLLITHDLAAAERVADTVAVMYAGRIVEHRAAGELFRAPGHPYSRGLLNALPDREFRAIAGHPPMLTALPEGCAFAARCDRVTNACASQPSGPVACHHPLTSAEVPA
ncbi:ABC transporter ATP-binding protein [Actinoplanes sp. NPDC026670]|uniref:ABC transporter ATP-binding protein n=1 Tax=Actinoplanes sp. NPDC026670 TaxID=3154700 RepID=UPI0033FDADDF